MSLFVPHEGSIRPDEERNTIQRFENGEWVDIVAPRSIFRMSPEERAEIMHKNPPEITSIHGASAYVDWSWMGCGFGQLSFHADPETGRITFMDECMGKERVRQILHALVDHLVDNGEFDERRFERD